MLLPWIRSWSVMKRLLRSSKISSGVELMSQKGFKLEFFFDTNPFFKNSVLTKMYHTIDEDDLIGESNWVIPYLLF